MEHRIALVEYWGIQKGDRVLDIGCGQVGLSFWCDSGRGWLWGMENVLSCGVLWDRDSEIEGVAWMDFADVMSLIGRYHGCAR